MAVYKVIQDIEAEDKFVGPLTLKQFIFMAIAFVSAYLCFFFITRHLALFTIPLIPIMLVGGFLGFPWRRDQPTEIWLLAKLRFMFKPHTRVWNQSGLQELVTITAPKKLEESLTNNLTQVEVKSRLKALAETIDSRGWAAKDANINLYAPTAVIYNNATSDRLVGATTLPQAKPISDVGAADDMMDEQHNPTAQHLKQMVTNATASHRKETLKQLDDIRAKGADKAKTKKDDGARPDFWFMNQPDTSKLRPGYAMFGAQTVLPGAADKVAAAEPTADDEALLRSLPPKAKRNTLAYGNTKVILPLDEQPVPTPAPVPVPPAPSEQPITAVTPPPDPAILNLATNDDLTVATIAREANKGRKPPPGTQELSNGEVIISLH